MRKFNLKLAQEGAAVCTKSKKNVRLLVFDRDNPAFPIVALIENKQVCCYTVDGKYYANKDSDNDLYML